MKKQVIFGLILLSVLLCISGQDEKDYQEPPTILIVLLVRNKAHTLPMFLSYLEQQNYPKKRIAFWLRCDHSNDDSVDLLRAWLKHEGDHYHSVSYVFKPEEQSYVNESSPYEWPASRFKHLIALKEEAFQYGRDIWADFVFFLDADVMLTSKDSLDVLTRLQLPIVAPMLISESLYSNFWCGMTEDYYYRRTDEYKEIYHVKKQGRFPVPMVHTAVLVNMNHKVVRNLTFDRSKLVEMQRSRQQEPLYDGPADDIIVFAISANSSGVPLHICNDITFGYILQPLEPGDTLEQDLQQLVNLKSIMVNDLGKVPPLLDYYKHLEKKPEKSKLSLDNIFMINLKRRPERREKMETLFEELGIDAEYFPAVDGKELTTERLQQMGVKFLPGYEDPYHHRAMTMGEIGCFLSHYSIWVMMVRKGLNEVLILEDDVRFEPYFPQNAVRVLNQARSVVEYDLIYFGRKRLKEESEAGVMNAENLVHAGYSYWTLGYVISLKGALKLLAAKPLEKLIPVDEFLPLMFDRHPNKTWSEAYHKRNLVAFSASPLLLYPFYYTGDSGYISDTEDSQQISVDTSEEGVARLKSDREQVFLQEEELSLNQQLKLGESAPALHGKCFDLFGEIANEHNGDVYETLHLIMRQTFPMHCYTDSPQSIGAGRRGGSMQPGEHISDWFIQLIDKYPDILIRILHFYIECVVTNPIKSWKSNEEKVAVGYAAKYDRILFSKCNKSCSEFVLEAVKADDAVGIQTRALDLIEKILMQQTEVGWSIFRYDVSRVPREVPLLTEVMRCLNDRTFTVRRKACQVLILALKQGSPMTTKILDESIRFVQFEDADVEALAEPSVEQNELRFEKPGIVQYAFSFEGHEEIEEEVKNVPRIVYERFLAADNGLARTAGIALLERLVLVNPLIIYNTNFVRETSLLAVDRLASVRKSALDTIETLLEAYSNCFALICVYCRIWACLMSDEDVALQKLAIMSFDRMVLRNIQPLEYSNEAKHFMPWRIISTLLMTQPRAYLQERFAVLLEKESIVTPRLINTIISHLSTSMATDAWGLLLLLSSRITNNMDALISIFNGLSSYNMKSNQFLALQLIIGCLRNFSKSALNQLFQRLLNALRTGSIWLGIISSAVNLLNQIHYLSASLAPSAASEMPDWQLNLLEDLTDGILSSAENFQDEYTRLQCLLGAYTEIIVMLPQDVDKRIVGIVFKYLQECTKLSESQFDSDNERMTNWMIVIAGRLCLRENNLANSVSKLYRTILTKNDRPQIINTTLIALNDLGKKHPSILESNFQVILSKLHSKFAMTRVRTFRCVKDVILSGNIKLKGPILISMLAGLVDESAEVAREADAFFIRYKRLYNKMLFDHCLKECPFDLNGQAYLRGVRTDSNYKSPLKGQEMTKNRRLLYNHIMSSVDENTLLLYFGQLKLLAEKTRDQAFVSNPGALIVVQDILFIMRRICFRTKGKGKEKSSRGEGDNSDEGEDEPMEAPPPPPSKPAAGEAPARGRGRKAELSEEPLKQLERCLRYVEETHRNLKSVMNQKLSHIFDNFCRALAMRFPNYIEFAQPAQFWQKYRSSKTHKGGKRKRRRMDGDEEVESEEEQQSESDSDNEMPLERHKTTPAGSRLSQRKTSCDMLVTELIFQPPDW